MKQIQLTHGKFALVDDEDYAYLMQWRWWFDESTGYAVRSGKPTVLMHREVNKTPKGLDTDHRDTDRLNNQRYNLRNATKAQNQMNRKSVKNSSSKYKGVRWYKRDKIWVVSISPNRTSIYLGRFKNEDDAARAYNVAALHHYGEFARLNIII